MIHPYKLYREDKEFESMDYINGTLEICTFYQGRPHGIALINYTDYDNKTLSFWGVGVFNRGELHNG